MNELDLKSFTPILTFGARRSRLSRRTNRNCYGGELITASF
ncbi:hypothetical protein [Nostoc sp.]